MRVILASTEAERQSIVWPGGSSMWGRGPGGWVVSLGSSVPLSFAHGSQRDAGRTVARPSKRWHPPASIWPSIRPSPITLWGTSGVAFDPWCAGGDAPALGGGGDFPPFFQSEAWLLAPHGESLPCSQCVRPLPAPSSLPPAPKLGGQASHPTVPCLRVSLSC